MRYTALLSGVFYGITHRRSLQKAHDAEVKHHAIHEREHLIEEAKEAWKRKQQGSKDGGEYHSVMSSPPLPHRLAPLVPVEQHAYGSSVQSSPTLRTLDSTLRN